VAERLRHVAEQLVIGGVDLLGEQPEVVGGPTSWSNRASARSTSPACARQATSQNEQTTNVPASPVRPSASAHLPHALVALAQRRAAVSARSAMNCWIAGMEVAELLAELGLALPRSR
jgi:hypothetical protein